MAGVSVRLGDDDAAALRRVAQERGVTMSDVLRDGARAIVNPHQNGRPVFVNEELPYRFDRMGMLTRGPQYDFSRDLIAGLRDHDQEAMQRVELFMAEQFDTDRADVAGLNPNRQRPDLYVDQRDYVSQVWDAINKGTLPDATPFVFPKFNAASGLVAAHTEGVEPTPGTFTVTAQTITPTPVSGKVEITRESWDQGGNPQLSGLIWRQMTRSWYEALEATGVALLDSLTPAQITLPVAAVDGALVDAFVDALVPLQFIRGGFAMTDMVTQVDLYKALANAKGTDGRKLIPALGPTNVIGAARAKWGALDLNGLIAMPSWALAASGTVAASSYLFDPESVHGWASAPNRLDFQYRVAYVDVAIWGYKATACSDIAGVREIVYDPA